MSIEAARTLGAGSPRIIVRYIVPNVLPTIIVLATVELGAAILLKRR